ncbi:MAG: PEGA domain-containing protein [Polyangiaceae bacterium]
MFSIRTRIRQMPCLDNRNPSPHSLRAAHSTFKKNVPRAIAATLLLLASAAHADDMVLLKNGGRMRGTVMSETPTDGVKIKLADGTVQSIAAAEIDHVVYDGATSAPQSAAPTQTPQGPSKPDTSSSPLQPGRLVITTTASAHIFIDGGERGTAPLDIPAIDQGTHAIRVVFDSGGSQTTRVSVMPNQTTSLNLEPSEAARAFGDRRGVHFGGTAELMTSVAKVNGAGARIAPFVNIGASPGFDFRVAPEIVFGVGHQEKVDDSKLMWSLGAAAQLRFNVGALYTLWFGANVGAWSLNGLPSNSETIVAQQTRLSPYFFFEASPVTIRFGEHREFEIGYTAGIGAVINNNVSLAFENLVGVSYLLPSF